MSNWIDPLDKLPEDGQDVLITVKDNTHAFGSILSKSVWQAVYHNDPSVAGTWYPFFGLWDSGNTNLVEEVEAWMPLPEPYNE